MLSCGNARGTLTETWQLREQRNNPIKLVFTWHRWPSKQKKGQNEVNKNRKTWDSGRKTKQGRESRNTGWGQIVLAACLMILYITVCHVLPYSCCFSPLSFPHSPYFFSKWLAWPSYLLSTNLLICQQPRQHLQTRLQEYKRSTG